MSAKHRALLHIVLHHAMKADRELMIRLGRPIGIQQTARKTKFLALFNCTVSRCESTLAFVCTSLPAAKALLDAGTRITEKVGDEMDALSSLQGEENVCPGLQTDGEAGTPPS
jgi:hypothetical protein